MKQATGIDQFIDYFNIDLNMKSNPEILNDIMENDFQISNFKLFTDAMHKQLSIPQDLGRLLNSIKKGIIEKHPSIDELLSIIVDKKLITRDELSESKIERAANYVYLHNCLIEFGDKDFKNEYELIKYLKNKRSTYGVQQNPITSWVGLYDSLKGIDPSYLRAFFVVKIKSVDFVINHLFMDRIKTGTAKPMNTMHKVVAVIALMVNITEAVTADIISKNYANALAGMALNIVLPKYVKERKEDMSKIEFGYSEKWSSLYHTWNSAYVTGTGVFFILHKLTIPLVANSEASEYMHKRVIALNNSLNFLIYNGSKSKVYAPLKNIDQIMRVWGGINLKHAKELLKETYFPKLTSAYKSIKVDIIENNSVSV